MASSFAGANKCNAETHDRPFIIEWDATDMSSFEAKAASDVVVVRYEGCKLQVLDRCSHDSVKGSNGAYGAVEWTSGSVEKLDVSNEAELFAKLPLGVATLGGRVQAGEEFHMEYFVTGTRKATRSDVYRADLEALPGCKGATHFVYAYNLGAFALGSKKALAAGVDGTVWGVGAGASQKSLTSAEKKGGVLTACTGESARETQSCKAPIRLTLRDISDGENPDVVAARAVETPTAKNLAGKLSSKLDARDRMFQHYETAREKANGRDGKGCLAELDVADRLNAGFTMQSTNQKSPYAFFRSQCLMQAGQCDAGKALARKYFSSNGSAMSSTPGAVDQVVDQQAAQMCQGATMSPRDQLLAASQLLGTAGSQGGVPASRCSEAFETVKRLASTVKPRDEDDHATTLATNLDTQGRYAAMCLSRAGDCAGAYKAMRETARTPPSQKAFDRLLPRCKGSAKVADGS